MKRSPSRHPNFFGGLLVVFSALCFLPAAALAGAAVNVTQHHNNLSRDGLYIDPAFTNAAAANLTRDDRLLTARSWATFTPSRFTSRAVRAVRWSLR